MPRMKLTEEQERILEIKGLLSKYQTIRNTDNKEIAKRLGISVSTYLRRKKNPDEMHQSDLWQLKTILHIPTEEIVNAVYGNVR